MSTFAPLGFTDAGATSKRSSASPASTTSMASSSPLVSWTPPPTEDSDVTTSSPSSDEDLFVTPSVGRDGREDWEVLSEMLLNDMDMQPFVQTADASVGAGGALYEPPFDSTGLAQPATQDPLTMAFGLQAPTSSHVAALLDPFSMPTELEVLTSTKVCEPIPSIPPTAMPTPQPVASMGVPPMILPTTAKPRSPPAPPVVSPHNEIGIKSEQLSDAERKKQRRRNQIATSVQRHREKKRQFEDSLKHEFTALTAHLEMLRAQRKQQHANNERLVAWEEEAVTQRRKRHQSEEMNQRLKVALFEQTSFLMGMRSITSNMPPPREMHIHDWLHSYTVLSARDVASRRKEYFSYFVDSKMDMAHKLILRETDSVVPHLSLANPYFAQVRILYDGTDCGYDVEDMAVQRELRQEEEFVVAGNGQLVKKLTSVFLFEERGRFTFDKFFEATVEATKQVGTYWPCRGYESEALDVLDLEDSSRMSYSNFHGSMTIHDNRVAPPGEDVIVETRMLSRTMKWEDEAVIAWDYADRDEMYPITGDRSIRRDTCGAVVIRREGNGLISYRSVSIKIFAPTDLQATIDDHDRALTQRRINLQTGELETAKQKCLRSVYDSLAAAFMRSVEAM
ncbi:hypothetical protein Poli38472_010953 [Pythium oligandrum]|uniref:BZIP domain-containing protein n=1 Tax=Pythium oligandrum TaxID=41045 RepID=A0A8K1FFP7_PYTOL|nr:hypothetical protein Poli38472_010953 [Pythium oligandrum]|eukprot:TMW61890.1 hypothetical protein Poli38472_010953 [Pythium oligandrum]